MFPRKGLSLALSLVLGTVLAWRSEPPGARAEEKPGKSKASRTDFYGDPLPENALARLSTVRLLHSNTISAVRFTPDSTRIIVASPGVRPALDHGEPSIRVWETASGKLVRGIAFPESRNGCLALTPDGKTLAVEVARGSINLLDLGTGKNLRQLGPRKREITALAFAPKGKTLAATVEDILLPLPGQGLAFRRQGQVVMWDVATGRSLHQFALPAKACCLAWSLNGKAIATGSSQGVALWDAASGKQRWHLAGAVSGAYAVACSPDGKVLAIGGEDGSLRLAALASGKVLCRFQRHRSPIHAVAFSADGKRLASGSDNGFLRLWDTATRKETHCLQGFHRAVTAVAFAPDGKTLASGGSEQTVKLWNPATGKERLPSSGHTGIIWSVAWSPDGKLVASGDSQRVIGWDPATGREVWRLPAPPAVSALAFSPDGKTLATVGWDGTVRLSEAATGKRVRSMRGREPRLLAVAWSPDGKLLACGGDEGSVPLWDVTTGKEIRRMHSSRPRTDVSCVAFSPDGRFLVTGTDDNTTPVYEVATGNEALRLTAQTSRTVDAAFSPDGRTLATGHADNSVRLWNVHTGKERRRLTGHTGTVAAVAFTRDGRVLLSGSDDGTIRMWETASGGGVLCFRGHGQGVTSIAVSPDGRRVVSGSRDSTALVWDVTGLGPDQGPEQPLSPAERVGLWQGLADTDAAAAQRAAWRLAASPRQAVRLVERELAPVKGVSSERLARLVDELDHDRFRVRQRASEELERLGEVAVPELYRRLAGKPSLEMRRRAEKLLEKVDPPELPPRRLREIRALGVLERAGTAEARQVLRSLAGGASGAWLTVEARAALQRLSRMEAK
jgi:WD40 repeat protein